MKALTVHSRQLNHSERMFLYHLLVQRTADHPVTVMARGLPYEHVSELMRVVVAQYEIKFAGDAGALRKFQLLRAREALYQRLLAAGAPARLLHRHFAKSHRQIARDRKAWGGRRGGRGRPRALTGGQAYEISGRWDSLCQLEPDFARRFAMLSDYYPACAPASLYALLDALA